mgnify:CR=1 FL=1
MTSELPWLMLFFFKQKTAYEISACLVGSEMCIRGSDSVIRIRVEKGIFKKGDNAFVDKMVFKKDTTVQSLKDYPIDDVFGKILKKGPEEYEDVKGLVIADYQNLLEERWIAELRKKYPVVVNKEVLETVNKH